MFFMYSLELFFGKRSNLKFTQTNDPQGCQEAVDTAAALILQRQWRRRQRKAGRFGAFWCPVRHHRFVCFGGFE